MCVEMQTNNVWAQILPHISWYYDGFINLLGRFVFPLITFLVDRVMVWPQVSLVAIMCLSCSGCSRKTAEKSPSRCLWLPGNISGTHRETFCWFSQINCTISLNWYNFTVSSDVTFVTRSFMNINVGDLSRVELWIIRIWLTPHMVTTLYGSL